MNRNRKCMSGVAAVLVFALILSSFGISVFAESGLKTFTPAKAAVGPDAYWPYFDEWNASKVFPSFAVRFKAASSFTGGMMALYVEGNTNEVNVKLYQWKKDYATSVAGAPKASTSTGKLEAPAGGRMEATYEFQTAQSAGEYVAVFEVTGESAFMPLKSQDMNNNLECYKGGAVIGDVDFFGGIIFEDSSAGGFKPLVNERITFTEEKASSESNGDIYWDYFNKNNDQGFFDNFAVRFKTKASFKGGMMSFYVEGTHELKVSLYKWNADYATSVKAAPQASVTFEVTDATNAGSRAEGNYNFETAQPAGEYVAVFEVVSPKSGSALIQLKAKDPSANLECYVAGEEILVDFFGGILFENYDDGGFVIVEKEIQSVPFYDTKAESTPLAITDSYGIQFATGMPFDKIHITCPSWGDNVGSLRWTLYRWQTSYADSIKGTAIASVDFIDIEDNAVKYFTFDEEMEAGEYLLLIENITEGTNDVGIYGVVGASEHAQQYIDGKISTEASAAMNIDVVGTGTDYYGTLSYVPGAEQNPGSGDAAYIAVFVAALAAATCMYALKKKKIAA